MTAGCRARAGGAGAVGGAGAAGGARAVGGAGAVGWALLSLAILFASTALTGCRSLSQAAARDVVGLVTTTGGEPIAGAQLRVGILTRTTTDAFGRFYLHDLSPGQHRVRASAAGHEAVDTVIEMHERAQLMHVQLATLTELIDLAIAAAVRKDLFSVQRLALRTAAIDPHDERVLLLQALVVHLGGELHP